MNFFKKPIIIFSLFLIFFIALTIYDSNHGALTRLRFNYINLKTDNIPKDYENLKIAAFGDIHYGSFLDYQTLDNFINKLNQQQVDVALFLGDLFDEIELNETMILEMSELLSKIEAPFGKFAVLGDQDLNHGQKLIEEILFNSGFEVLSNKKINLYDSNGNYIQLIGLDNLINGNINHELLLEDINYQIFSLVFSHTPDIALDLPKDYFDRLISSHSQNSQIKLPFFNRIDDKIGANYFKAGHHQYQSLEIDVVHGLGTKVYQRRFFSNPEIIIYQFQ